MPSGAKKRKAAKKKKESQPSASNNNPHDRDDAKSQGSDGSEVCSPASQGDHSNHHPFNDGDRSRASSAENAPRGDEEEQKLGFMDSIVGKIEQRLKSDGSSSSSSSDDESRAAEKKKKKDKEAIPVAENKSNGSDIFVTPVIQVETAMPVIPEVIKAENSAEESSKTVQETVSLPVSDYDSKASPSEFESDSKGYVGKELPQSDVYVASPSKGSEIPEHSANQPPVAPVQKTSVFSCCGIFDLFSRSS